jgi:hypothetical protein
MEWLMVLSMYHDFLLLYRRSVRALVSITVFRSPLIMIRLPFSLLR